MHRVRQLDPELDPEPMKNARAKMISQLELLGVDQSVLDAMARVPRHLFVPPQLRDQAYRDTPLSIGHGQTISAPHMVAIMCDLLELRPGQKILEIGTGSGYHAAVIAELVYPGEVFSVERIPQLAKFARSNLDRLGYSEVHVFVADGSKGLEWFAPYDGICVTCTAPNIPDPLLNQLKIGGRMVIPVGRFHQELYLVIKHPDRISTQRMMGVAFVPMVGEYGFKQ